MTSVVCNTRTLATRLSGVQRYTIELLAQMNGRVETLAPAHNRSGLSGHVWEQAILPLNLHGRLLWSPGNTGPISVRHQVVTMHDVAPFDIPETFSRKFVAWYQFMQPKLLRRAVGIITVSNFTRQRLLDRIPGLEAKTVAIYNGIDKRFAPQPDSAIADAAQSLALPSRRYLLSVGSLEPRKNLRRLMQAWSSIVDRVPDDVWLVLAGGRGAARIYADHDTAHLPTRVHMTGHVPEDTLPALISGAMAFLYPSLYEGFGLPPLEAMACGTAALTANNSCLPEIVGDAALQVDPHDVAAIAAGMLTLIEDATLRSDLETRGLERAKRYTWEKAARETFALFEKCA